MHFPLKQIFTKKRNTETKQAYWRRFLRILILHRRTKCKRKLSEAADYNVVRFLLSRNPPFCFDCQRAMDSHIALYQHCRTQHPKSLVNAVCCDAEYYTLAALAAHCESAHTGQHICIRCCMFFESQNALKDHLSEHRSKKEVSAFFCIVCGAFNNSKQEIESHLRSEHDVDDGREAHYVCEVPQLALEMTSILEKPEDQGSFSRAPPRVFTPTLKDCMSYTFHETLQVM